MRRRLGGLMVALLGTLVTHVAEAAVEATLDSNGQPPADYVRTPNGYFHKSCVHDVPNGAQVDDNDNVTTNGVVTHFEPCQYPVISTPSASLASSAPSPTIGHAWVESIEQDQSGQGFNLLEVNSQIPGIPCYPGDQQTIYLFNGLEPVFNAFPLIQPVIGYVYLSGNTGTQLEIAAVVLTSSNNTGSSINTNVNPGDKVDMAMWVISNKPVVGKTWQIQIVDQANGQFAAIQFTTTADMNAATPAVLEVYNVSQCEDYPTPACFEKGSSVFSSITLAVPCAANEWTSYCGVGFAPFPHNPSPSLNPQCGYGITTVSSRDETTFTY